MAYWLYEKVEAGAGLLTEEADAGLLAMEAGGQTRDEGTKREADGRGRPRSRSRVRSGKGHGEVGRFGKTEVLRTGSDRNNFAILL